MWSRGRLARARDHHERICSLPNTPASVTIAAVANYIGAIDQGTTSTRFCVFDAAGKIVAVAQKEHQQIYPQPGWVEHDPEEIWQATQDVIAQALQQGNFAPPTWRRSASPTSAKPPCCGTGKPASPWPTRWSGRTRGWMTTSPSSPAKAGPTAFDARPGFRSAPTSAV